MKLTSVKTKFDLTENLTENLIVSNDKVFSANWLKSNYEDDTWEITDSRPLSRASFKIRFNIIVFDPARPDEICRLTDTEYANLLTMIKAQIFGLRTGKFAVVTSAVVHNSKAASLINWAIWMISNNIKCFSHLIPEDFEAYRDACLDGWGPLLQYAKILKKGVAKLRAANIEIPHYSCSTGRPHLDVAKLLTLVGIDPPRGRSDKETNYELLKIAEKENFYLTPTQRQRLALGPRKAERIATVHLLLSFQPWHYQWKMRNSLPGKCIQFNPFEGTSPDQLAFEIGKPTKRTQTVHVGQTMELIDRALRWVLDYSPVLFELRSQFEKLFAQNLEDSVRHKRMKKIVAETILPQGPGGFAQLDAGTKRISNGISFGMALQEFLPSACFIVIAAFTARRLEEILSVRAAGENNEDCISSDANGYYLETYIVKTVRDWEKLPCSEAVVAAIEVLRMWSEPARKLSGDVKLFRYKNLISNKVPLFRQNRSLNEFARFLSLPTTDNGEQWIYKPHQFRRFFAIMYFWRFEYGNLSALSQQLRHFNTEMTQIYVTEIETGEIFKHVGREFTTTILSEAATGKRNVSGPFGEKFKEKFKKLIEKYRRQTKVVSPKLINETVERYVDMSNRRLKGFKWGYCACGTSTQQLATARCLQDSEDSSTAIEPDASKSSPAVCGDCPHHLTGEAFKDFWKEELDMHERAAADPKNGNLLREASRRRAETLKRQYERSFIKSETLKEVLDEK